MVIVSAPNNYKHERSWIISELFSRIGVDYRVEFDERENYCISVQNSTKKIIVDDIFIK